MLQCGELIGVKGLGLTMSFYRALYRTIRRIPEPTSFRKEGDRGVCAVVENSSSFAERRRTPFATDTRNQQFALPDKPQTAINQSFGKVAPHAILMSPQSLKNGEQNGYKTTFT